jgi:hypothetical protein
MIAGLSTRAVNKVISIAKSSTEKYRAELNKNVHVADISYQALKASVPSLEEIEYTVILDAFNSQAANSSTSLTYALKQVKNLEWKGLTYVDDPKYGEFLIATSYATLQQYSSKIVKSLSGAYSNLSELLGIDEKGNTLARIGHIASSFSHTSTPLLEKLADVYKRLPQLAANKVASQIFNLKSSHTFDVNYSFDRMDIANKLSSVLGRGVVLVTIQSDARNAALAKIEAKINSNVIKYLESEEFAQDILVEPGSNTIIQDIAFILTKVLDPKLKQPAKHGKKPTTKKQTTIHDGSKVLPIKVPRLRTLQGQFYSLTSLQNLINRQLQDVISANMGDGDRRNILNYRTGRLAASAKVESMSLSRAGMITAFYSYMKNPYATFSDGGRQQYPKTRDPKLLISKSIREIAATQVANQLRAVNV